MKSLPKSYDVGRLNDSNIAEAFKARIGGAFEPLLQLQDTDADELWKQIYTTNNITEEVVGFKRSNKVEGLPEDDCKTCEQRRKARILVMNNPSAHNKKSYKKLNKTVKYEVKNWKKKILDAEVEEMEIAHAKNNSHELFKKVKKLSGERDEMQPAVKNKDGIFKTAPAEVLKCWEEHFSGHFTTQFPRV